MRSARGAEVPADAAPEPTPDHRRRTPSTGRRCVTARRRPGAAPMAREDRGARGSAPRTQRARGATQVDAAGSASIRPRHRTCSANAAPPPGAPCSCLSLRRPCETFDDESLSVAGEFPPFLCTSIRPVDLPLRRSRVRLRLVAQPKRPRAGRPRAARQRPANRQRRIGPACGADRARRRVEPAVVKAPDPTNRISQPDQTSARIGSAPATPTSR